jgi:glycopeptide antibiotics resistance protein
MFGFDKVMHTFGGIFLAFLVAWYFWNTYTAFSYRKLFWTLIVGVLVIGIAWEGYEYLVQWFIKPLAIANIPDSIGDVIFDTLGGMLGAYLVILERRRYNTL